MVFLRALRLSTLKPAQLLLSPNIRQFATRKAMEAHQVVPDVIPVAPKALATISYPSGVKVR